MNNKWRPLIRVLLVCGSEIEIIQFELITSVSKLVGLSKGGREIIIILPVPAQSNSMGIFFYLGERN